MYAKVLYNLLEDKKKLKHDLHRKWVTFHLFWSRIWKKNIQINCQILVFNRPQYKHGILPSNLPHT
jgi:ABC-type oligopeptide transport system substrate-binding subunit